MSPSMEFEVIFGNSFKVLTIQNWLYHHFTNKLKILSLMIVFHWRRKILKEVKTPCKDFYLNEPIRLFCSINCDKNKIDKRPVFLS